MNPAFHDAQRIVLHGTPWRAARHLMLNFGPNAAPRRFLHQLQAHGWPCGAGHHTGHGPLVQVSLGFTRRGLERAGVPAPVMANFALQAPAFWAGAALRASSHLGMTDGNAPERWSAPFADASLHAVLSLHGRDEASLLAPLALVQTSLQVCGLNSTELPLATALDAPGEARTAAAPAAAGRQQWVHFGFRDGLSRIGIRQWDAAAKLRQCLSTSQHEIGEFLLGQRQDSGATPWLAGPDRRVWPEAQRAFFRNGSFGVLQQMAQDVGAFEAFVRKTATATGLTAAAVKGKLCGRTPDGRPLATPAGTDPQADFDYAGDPQGHGCPFGSHVRRMNPRLPPDRAGASSGATAPGLAPAASDVLAHSSRTRALLRRGLPYGRAWTLDRDREPRGLLGQFFCTSIEDQFEHLLGEWAERVPLGSADGGGARDPLIGTPDAGDGPFELPRADGRPLLLHGLGRFVSTIGAAYLFYPSLRTLQGIADSSLWGLDDQGDDA